MTEDLRKAAEAAKAARETHERTEDKSDRHLMYEARDELWHECTDEAILALYAERDAAIARAEKAEKERDEASGYDARAMEPSELAVVMPGGEADRLKRLVDGAVEAIRRAEAAEASLAAVTAERDAMRGALGSIDIYGSDTLSGNATGPNNAKWYLDGVRVMRDCAREAIKELTNAEQASPPHQPQHQRRPAGKEAVVSRGATNAE